MSVWGDTYHPTHDPAPPRASGFSTGLVFCTRCGTLLRSERGMSTAKSVIEPCPVAVPPWRTPEPTTAGEEPATRFGFA